MPRPTALPSNGASAAQGEPTANRHALGFARVLRPAGIAVVQYADKTKTAARQPGPRDSGFVDLDPRRFEAVNSSFAMPASLAATKSKVASADSLATRCGVLEGLDLTALLLLRSRMLCRARWLALML